jgi:hypothetical protein
MRIVFHSEASAELAEAAEWYQSREDGLGDDLMEVVDRAVQAVTESPETWPSVPRTHRQIRRF